MRPLVWLLLGPGVGVARRTAALPISAGRGALIVANHNSHLDPFILSCLIPWRDLGRVRLVGAADYFLERPVVAWFYRWSLRMIPIERRRQLSTTSEASKKSLAEVLRPVDEALARRDILLYFPEGTRGEPGVVAPIKYGLVALARRWPDVPIVPVRLSGVDVALPKGGLVVVPQEVDVTVGERLSGAPRYEALRDYLTEFWS